MSLPLPTKPDLDALFSRGYADRKSGAQNDAALWLDLGPRGRAYRDGNRERRREESEALLHGPETLTEVAMRAQQATVEALRPAIARATGIPESRLYGEKKEEVHLLKVMEKNLMASTREHFAQVADLSAPNGFDPAGRKKRKAAKPAAPTDQLNLL